MRGRLEIDFMVEALDELQDFYDGKFAKI